MRSIFTHGKYCFVHIERWACTRNQQTMADYRCVYAWLLLLGLIACLRVNLALLHHYTAVLCCCCCTRRSSVVFAKKYVLPPTGLAGSCERYKSLMHSHVDRDIFLNTIGVERGGKMWNMCGLGLKLLVFSLFMSKSYRIVIMRVCVCVCL